MIPFFCREWQRAILPGICIEEKEMTGLITGSCVLAAGLLMFRRRTSLYEILPSSTY